MNVVRMDPKLVGDTTRAYYCVATEDEFHDLEAWGRENSVGIHYHEHNQFYWRFYITGEVSIFTLRWL